MNRLFIALCLLVSMSTAAFAQNYTKHTVVRGETVTQIAAKYKVTPYDIYRLNPDSQGGIKENDVILVPGSTLAKPVESGVKNTSAKTHVAEPKETWYSISRKYGVGVPDLQAANPEAFKDGIKIGQTIKIPGSGHPPTVAVESKPQVITTPKANEQPRPASSAGVYHVVQPKETKFGIAKKYGITVAELERKNPDIVANLPIGYKLTISGATAKQEPVEKPKPTVHDVPAAATTTATTEVVKTTKFSGFANYEVKPKETLFSLSQMFDITQEELLMLNPTLKDGVKVGMILKVPGKGSITKIESAVSNGRFADLTKSIKATEKKQLVLLLPFNAAKIQGDTVKNLSTRLKKDAFLNMTLDFYSGALMAIDSAKAIGLNIDVKIFDSEESKLSSNVAAVIEKNNVAKADAVIGPFYQQYVEKVAEMLQGANVPVISPLSKETGKPFPNLYQAMPPSDFTKGAMMDFLRQKAGNVLVVSDPKRQSNKEFITKNYAEAKFVTVSETGAVDMENLKSLLVKDKVNYVVLDTEKTGMILSSTNTLLAEMPNFQIQIAIIEPNETLDFEEVSMKRLTLLKLLYPSLTYENNTPEGQLFENSYKNKNKIFPSQFAVRGFDVTFDTMLRLSQGKTFAESADQDKTQQVESKFEYAKKPGDGYTNKGVYILEYQEDLSVKQVNN
ncbi:PBP1 and LysM peptidoglycan-binding domain-containing protein [Flavobacterium caeni]|uniref:LysM repeat-containing protein n=1 Tax=Flavobacterium caeni TaxID=490189 RepID=A0A1G5JKI7_9FLAO|nr:LysM peptidoglycan-binding domain-containing protein [Flavobacterium caeni]SCY88674.1 LysM repeat-containing protein [Flavobacterium caeni]